MEARSGAIDALRVIGVIAIVAGHVWENTFIRQGLYIWHVPLFFFLTGYLWRPRRTLRIELSKRFQSLLIPYFVWLFVIGLGFLFWLLRGDDLTWEALIDLALGGNRLGRPFSAFWFVTALFAVTLLLRMMQAIPRWMPWVVSVVGLAFSYANPSVVASLPFSVGVAIPALIFVLAGTQLRARLSVIRNQLITGAGLLLLSGSLVMMQAVSPLDMKQADFGTPVISVVVAIFICTGLVLIVQPLFESLPPALNNLSTTLAKGGFLVVLTHASFLWVLQVSDSGSFIAFLVALGFPLVFAITVQRSRFAPYLLGVPSDRVRSERAI